MMATTLITEARMDVLCVIFPRVEMAACTDVNVRALYDMIDEFRLNTLDPLADFIIKRSRQAVLGKIAALPQSTWSHKMTIEEY